MGSYVGKTRTKLVHKCACLRSRLQKCATGWKFVVVTGLTRPLSFKTVEFLVSLLLLILSLPILLYYNLRKFYALVAAKQRFGRHTTLVEGTDYLFMLKRFSADPSAALTTVLKVDGEVSLEALRHRVKANLTHRERWDGSWTHEKLRTIYQPFMGYCITRRENPFDISRHVDHVWDASTGMRIYCRTEEEVADLVDTLSARPIFSDDGSSEPVSPWVMYLIHCKSPGGRRANSPAMLSSSTKKSFIILRSDHALFDGVSLVAILLDGLVDSKPGSSESKLCLNSYKERSRLRRWWLELRGILKAWGNLVRHSLLDTDDLNPFVQGRKRLPSSNFEGVDDICKLRRKKITNFPTFIPLHVLEDIRRMTGVKLNSIAIWAYLRALLHYSNKRAALAASPSSASLTAFARSKSRSTLASSPSLASLGGRRMSVIIDRDRRHWTFSLGQPVCMWMPGSTVKLENRIAIVRRSFSGHEVAGEGWDTLRKVQRSLEREDVDEDVWAFYAAVKYFFSAMPIDVLEKLYKFLGPKISVASTNIRGAQGEQSILRHKVEWASMIVPVFEGVDVGLAVGSYNGNLTLAVAASEGAVTCREDVQELQDIMESEVLNLHHSLTSTSIHEEDIRQFFTFSTPSASKKL